MPGFIYSMFITVLGVVLYQLAQKLQPTSISPFLILAIAYFVAALICTSICFLISVEISSIKDVLLLPSCLGITLVIVELGFLLVYRTGWKISIAGVFSTVAATVVLIPLGNILLKEDISKVNLVGIFLCLIGLFLTLKTRN